MCLYTEHSKMDPALLLANLLSTAGVKYDEGHLRRMIRDHWDRICMLAHQIHDEETSPEVCIRRAAAALERPLGNLDFFMECVAAAGFEVRRK